MIDYSKYLKKDSVIIFLFHGVIDKNPFKIRNYNNKHLLASDFTKVLNILKKKGNCISMDEVYERIKTKKKFSNYSFAITFDDGFYNNFKIAIPILIKKKLKATFYITSNFIEKNSMSWVDKIEYMIENISDTKILSIFNSKFIIHSNMKSKIEFLKKIRILAKQKKNIDLDLLVGTIKKQLKFKKRIGNLKNILDRKMNWKNIKKINSNNLFLIGGHTQNHKILSFLNNKSCNSEIEKCISTIKNKTNISLEHFSYPEGLKHTYGNREIKILKKNKIKICPSAEFGFNDTKSNLFHLKRVIVDKI